MIKKNRNKTLAYKPKMKSAQLAWAEEYTNCISAEEYPHPPS